MRKTYEGFETWYNELLMTIKMHVVILVILVAAHLAVTSLAVLALIDTRALWATLPVALCARPLAIMETHV